MHYLYGSKRKVDRRLLATFGSEQQLLAYVHWATLQDFGENRGKFEQGSSQPVMTRGNNPPSL